MPRIRFLLDEKVSNSVIGLLEDRGHEVLLSREVTAAGTSDTVLAVLTAHESLVVVSHDKHFRSYKDLLPEHDRNRLAKGAGRIQLEVAESRARARLEEELPLLEFHYEQCRRTGRPFRVTIREHNLKLDTS